MIKTFPIRFKARFIAKAVYSPDIVIYFFITSFSIGRQLGIPKIACFFHLNTNLGNFIALQLYFLLSPDASW